MAPRVALRLDNGSLIAHAEEQDVVVLLSAEDAFDKGRLSDKDIQRLQSLIKYLQTQPEVEAPLDNVQKHEKSRIQQNLACSMPEPVLQQCKSLLNKLKSRLGKRAAWFASPVDAHLAPGYYNIIQHPMDFSTILDKLKTGLYMEPSQFAADVELVWANCKQYNTPGDMVYMAGVQGAEIFKRLWSTSSLSASSGATSAATSLHYTAPPTPAATHTTTSDSQGIRRSGRTRKPNSLFHDMETDSQELDMAAHVTSKRAYVKEEDTEGPATKRPRLPTPPPPSTATLVRASPAPESKRIALAQLLQHVIEELTTQSGSVEQVEQVNRAVIEALQRADPEALEPGEDGEETTLDFGSMTSDGVMAVEAVVRQHLSFPKSFTMEQMAAKLAAKKNTNDTDSDSDDSDSDDDDLVL